MPHPPLTTHGRVCQESRLRLTRLLHEAHRENRWHRQQLSGTNRHKQVLLWWAGRTLQRFWLLWTGHMLRVRLERGHRDQVRPVASCSSGKWQSSSGNHQVAIIKWQSSRGKWQSSTALPLFAHHSPLTTHHSLRATTLFAHLSHHAPPSTRQGATTRLCPASGVSHRRNGRAQGQPCPFDESGGV